MLQHFRFETPRAACPRSVMTMDKALPWWVVVALAFIGLDFVNNENNLWDALDSLDADSEVMAAPPRRLGPVGWIAPSNFNLTTDSFPAPHEFLSQNFNVSSAALPAAIRDLKVTVPCIDFFTYQPLAVPQVRSVVSSSN